MSFLRTGLLTLLIGTVTAGPARAGDFGIGDPSELVKLGYYTSRLAAMLAHWPLPTQARLADHAEVVIGIRTPAESDIIGMVKHSVIDAPLARVAAVSERVEDYPAIWENVVAVKRVSTDRNRLVTEWARKAPAFFLPRIRYRTLTTIDRQTPGRIVYRHQFVEGNLIRSSDFLVVYESLPKDRTRVTVLGFFEPEMGVFRSLAEGKVWRQSLENGFKDDVAFRLRVEHPEWGVDRLTNEAERALENAPLEPLEYTEAIRPDRP